MDFALTLKYAARHMLKRNPRVLRWCAGLMSRERADPAIHRARQELFLERILRAARRIPAYARHAARAPGRGRTRFLADEFPIIDKNQLLQRREEFFPNGREPKLRSTIAATSGTTGTPLDVYRDLGSILREETFHLQHWHWAGWTRGNAQSVLRGDIIIPLDHQRTPYWFNDRVGKQLLLSTRHLDRQTAPLFAEALQRAGTTQLRAYPSAAYHLATFLEQEGVRPRFSAVITGSEMLYDFQRSRIESVFNTRVYDFYSMAERVTFAAECEFGRMHVNPEYGLVEIIDEQGIPTEGEGTIVGTSLHNELVPLIRYRTQDTARWSREPCACGRTYPVIEKIGGRLADQLFDLDGRAVNSTVIGFALDGMRNIQKAQVVQTAVGNWTIRIVPSAGYTAADGQRVLDQLARHVSARVASRVELVHQIPVLPNGKYKWVRQAIPGAMAR